MGTVFLFLVRMLILQCFLHWCSPVKKTHVTLESFMRWNKTHRFLKAEWDKGKKEFKLSFNGLSGDANTKFIFSHKNDEVTSPFNIHLANDFKYFLAVNDSGSGLVVKKLSDTTEIKGNFTTHRLEIPFTEECGINHAHVIESLALEGKFIKSSRSGLVSLGEKDDCGCWVRT